MLKERVYGDEGGNWFGKAIDGDGLVVRMRGCWSEGDRGCQGWLA